MPAPASEGEFLNNWPYNHLGANGLAAGVEPLQGFLIEAMVTFILVLVVYGCCDTRRDDVKGSVPLAIGLTVGVSHLLSVSLAFVTKQFYSHEFQNLLT